MKYSTQFTKIRKAAAMLVIPMAFMMASCNKDVDEPTPPQLLPPLTANEILGAWEAEGYIWDLEGKSTLYLLDDNSDSGYAEDENGDYITVTAREFCEQYAIDYNADPKNEIKGTAEDFAIRPFEETTLMTNINVTDKTIMIVAGLRGMMVVQNVYGEYTYNEQTGIITVEDVAIEDDPRTLEIKVWKDADGYTNFKYVDFDMFSTKSYDGTKSYYAYLPMTFYCMPGEPYLWG